MNAPYVQPHKIVSRDVTIKDLETLNRDAKIMIDLCAKPHGLHPSAIAIAHSQINDSDPLRFFVTSSEIIVNPRIIRHSSYEVTKKEGCMSFPDRKTTEIKRWPKMEVEFVLVHPGEEINLSDITRANLSGLQAEVFQHEMDHFDGKYIFNFN